MSEKGAPKRASRKETPPGQKWHLLPDEQVPGALMSTIKHIKDNQSQLDQESLIGSGLYAGRVPGSSFGVPHHHAAHGVHPSLSGRLTYNVIGIVVDALVSKLTKENLSTQFLTNGGDYRQQRRAKKLSQFGDGVNYETRMDEIGPDVLRDALLTPCGIVHTFADWATKRVKSERVMGLEMFVDYADGFYGEPRQVFRIKAMDREVVLDAWGDDKKVAEAIKSNHDTDPLGLGEYQGLSDIVYVGEAWRLPSGVDEDGETTDDGRHVLFLSNCILTPPEERVWKKKRFPFSVYRWKKDTAGWHGIPLARDLRLPGGDEPPQHHVSAGLPDDGRLPHRRGEWHRPGSALPGQNRHHPPRPARRHGAAISHAAGPQRAVLPAPRGNQGQRLRDCSPLSAVGDGPGQPEAGIGRGQADAARHRVGGLLVRAEGLRGVPPGRHSLPN